MSILQTSFSLFFYKKSQYIFLKNVNHNIQVHTIIPRQDLAINQNNNGQYFIDFIGLDKNSVKYTVHIFKTNNTIFLKTNCAKTPLFFKNLFFWPIREAKELFNLNIITTDTRNLLLDYSVDYPALLKAKSCEGDNEIYFNFFTQKTEYIGTEYIEL